MAKFWASTGAMWRDMLLAEALVFCVGFFNAKSFEAIFMIVWNYGPVTWVDLSLMSKWQTS